MDTVRKKDMTDRYVALDVETTGLDPAKDRLLEIGAVKVEDGEIRESYETLINTGVPIPYRIQELTGITDEMQKAGKTLEAAMEEIVRFCEGYPILGHNVQFDYGFLKQNAVMCGLGFEKDGIDTLKIARKVLPDMRSRSLPAMCAYYRVDPGNSHRALDDARSAHEIFRKMQSEFGGTEPQAFVFQKMMYSVKKECPITNSQKGYLNDLLKYHKIEMSICVEEMTKSEASRMIDHIILQYGRIGRRKG